MTKTLVASLVAATLVVGSTPADARKRYYHRGAYSHEVRCKRHGGTTGAIIGGAAGGLLGREVIGGTGGTLVGIAGGALGGRAIERSHKARHCR
jgi:uncharacterized protein YcfJ